MRVSSSNSRGGSSGMSRVYSISAGAGMAEVLRSGCSRATNSSVLSSITSGSTKLHSGVVANCPSANAARLSSDRVFSQAASSEVDRPPCDRCTCWRAIAASSRWNTDAMRNSRDWRWPMLCASRQLSSSRPASLRFFITELARSSHCCTEASLDCAARRRNSEPEATACANSSSSSPSRARRWDKASGASLPTAAPAATCAARKPSSPSCSALNASRFDSADSTMRPSVES